jgi:lysozyme
MQKNLIEHIKKYEGFSNRPYLCPANVPTIGYGSTYYSNGVKVTLNDAPMSEQQATELLTKEVNVFRKRVISLLKRTLNDNEINALTSFAYNVGLGDLKGSTLLKKVNMNAPIEEICKEFMKWINVNGKPSRGLILRRKAELLMYAFSEKHN